MELDKICEKMISAIKEAGKIILYAHRAEDTVTEKPGTSNFVTEYDLAVQSFLIDEIKKILPDAYFLAEEKENSSDIEKREICVVIDPIDGTANFINNYRHSCISVAILFYGKAVFGAVYDPYQDEMFSAADGLGAFLNGKRLTVAERPMERAIVAFGTSPYHKSTLCEKTFSLAEDIFLVANDVRRSGPAALDLAYLAAGRNDIFFEFILQPWDFAAGYVLVKEAGGIITDMSGSSIIHGKSSSVIAASRGLYRAALEKAKKYIEQ